MALAVILAAGLAWWLFHPRPTDRELIDQLIARAVHGVETKSVDEIMGCVAPDYQDELGLRQVDVWRGAMRWGQTVDKAEVEISDYRVDIHPPTATGRLEVRLTITQNGHYLEPEPLHLMVQFEQERQRWRKVWLVKSVSGYGQSRTLEDLM